MALNLRTIYILSAVEPRLKVKQPRYDFFETGILNLRWRCKLDAYSKILLELNSNIPGLKPGM